jgi:4-hydroxybenzoate polyprenyltransferase
MSKNNTGKRIAKIQIYFTTALALLMFSAQFMGITPNWYCAIILLVAAILVMAWAYIKERKV